VAQRKQQRRLAQRLTQIDVATACQVVRGRRDEQNLFFEQFLQPEPRVCHRQHDDGQVELIDWPPTAACTA